MCQVLGDEEHMGDCIQLVDTGVKCFSFAFGLQEVKEAVLSSSL